MEMKNPEVVIHASGAIRRNEIMIHNRWMINAQATLALDLVRAGFIAGVDDGETSTGAQKFRPMESDVLVARAMDIAERTFKAIDERGWTTEYPSWHEIQTTETDGPNKPGF